MTRGNTWFLLILIINFIIVLIYYLYNLLIRRIRFGNYVMRCIVMLLCPIFGAVFFLCAYLYYKLFMRDPVNLEDVVFSKDRVKTYLKADENSEMNLVPVEEAIAVTDKESTRNLMLEVVRRDVTETLGTISIALNSDDSEISHYAASVLQQELNKFRNGVQQIYSEINRIKEDEQMDISKKNDLLVELSRELFEDINKICSQKVFSEMERETYVNRMEEALIILDDLFQAETDEIAEMSLRFLEIKDYERCRKWCDRNYELYPNSLASYTSQLKLYYSIEDKPKFFAILNELKNSQIPIDHETLEMIRVFL
ncbi:MAG: hypothetical protein J6Z03_06685 [Erysipelotrichaceae bacterium]|nr:hypothetical protein [Erysipelotrichaceae bacterium]